MITVIIAVVQVPACGHCLHQNSQKSLKLTGDHSLIQMAYHRAKRLGDTVYVVTEASHSDHVREQLSELPEEAFLLSPGRRARRMPLYMRLMLFHAVMEKTSRSRLFTPITIFAT